MKRKTALLWTVITLIALTFSLFTSCGPAYETKDGIRSGKANVERLENTGGGAAPYTARFTIEVKNVTDGSLTFTVVYSGQPDTMTEFTREEETVTLAPGEERTLVHLRDIEDRIINGNIEIKDVHPTATGE